jgi:hypothetical protein
MTTDNAKCSLRSTVELIMSSYFAEWGNLRVLLDLPAHFRRSHLRTHLVRRSSKPWSSHSCHLINHSPNGDPSSSIQGHSASAISLAFLFLFAFSSLLLNVVHFLLQARHSIYVSINVFPRGVHPSSEIPDLSSRGLEWSQDVN